MYAEVLIAILLVVFVYLISRVSRLPFYIDPYGEKSVRLTNRLSPISWLASHILTFLSSGKYKLLPSYLWREEKIEDAAISEEEPLEAKFVTGETGKGMRESIWLALKRGFRVILLTGIPYCDAIDDIKKFLEYPKFELYLDVTHRPEKHFTIITNKHIFLEVPHLPFQEKKYSLGINNAKPELVNLYTEKFDKMKEKMQKTSLQEFEEIVSKSICLLPPQKGKPWWRFWEKRKDYRGSYSS
jgi:hypothetical protein